MNYTNKEILEIAKTQRPFYLTYWLFFFLSTGILVLNCQWLEIEGVKLFPLSLVTLIAILLAPSFLLIYFMYRMATVLKKGIIVCLFSCMLVLMPIIGFLVFLVYLQKTIIIMKKEGVPSGLLGTSAKHLRAFSDMLVNNVRFQPNINYAFDYTNVDKQRKLELFTGIVLFFIVCYGAGWYLSDNFENDLKWEIHTDNLSFSTLRSIDSFKKKYFDRQKDKEIPESSDNSFSKGAMDDEPQQTRKIEEESNDANQSNVAMTYEADTCSNEKLGNDAIPFLWCTDDLCKGMMERVVKDARFSIKTIWYWQKEPTVTQFKDWAVYRFMNEEKSYNKQWISITYLNPPEKYPPFADVGKLVDSEIKMKGEPYFDVPDNQRYSGLNFKKIDKIDRSFMKKHALTQMASYSGTIKVNDTICCAYIVLMQKGREIWKMEVVFPANYHEVPAENDIKIQKLDIKGNLEDAATNPANMKMAGMYFGHFKILK